MAEYDYLTDVAVVGSGGGGLVCALVAKLEGLDSIVLEKTQYYGGSTAMSGGGIWIPNNHLMAKAGVPDSYENALTYMKCIAGDRVPEARLEAYVRRAPEALRYLEDRVALLYCIVPGYSDYYAELPGGTVEGRGLEPIPFDGRKLGDNLKALKNLPYGIPGGISVTIGEYCQLSRVKTTTKGKLAALKFGMVFIKNRLLGVERLTMGRALVGRLRYSLMKQNIPLWLDSPAKRLLTENGRVVGVEILKDGKPFAIQARKGVVLAAGGFARNLEMRKRYQQHPITVDWTVANEGNTGDAINMGIEIGAAIDLMDDAWWGSTSLLPSGQAMFHVSERALPGTAIVNSAGRRFGNEAAPYTDWGHSVYEANSSEASTIPCYYIMDQRARNNYMFGLILPGRLPKEYITSGYVKKANTIRELALQCGIDQAGLEDTVERMRVYAQDGKDGEFGKGDTTYDRFYGDPTVKPNPCLAPIEKPPYYAAELFPGDLGTKGGLVTDENARVLRSDGSVVDGLFSTGNNSASVMGNSYAGPGATIGPAITFGYLAAMHMAHNSIFTD
jgi:3-oxosteroid 1-dehydrogenase